VTVRPELGAGTIGGPAIGGRPAIGGGVQAGSTGGRAEAGLVGVKPDDGVGALAPEAGRVAGQIGGPPDVEGIVAPGVRVGSTGRGGIGVMPRGVAGVGGGLESSSGWSGPTFDMSGTVCECGRERDPRDLNHVSVATAITAA
jgi:hypothetical protein